MNVYNDFSANKIERNEKKTEHTMSDRKYERVEHENAEKRVIHEFPINENIGSGQILEDIRHMMVKELQEYIKKNYRKETETNEKSQTVITC